MRCDWLNYRAVCEKTFNRLAVSNPLSVLHVNAMDNSGGSGRAAYRTHLGLRQLGVRSRMLVGWKVMHDDHAIGFIGDHRLWMADRLCDRIWEPLSLQYLFYPSSFSLRWRHWYREADVVQLYNTHGGYFSHTVLPALSRRRPVVWRLSDMWPMTGHCAYSFDCERWKTGCGRCPILADYPALRHDRTALLWRIKQRVYRHADLTIVAPSRWLAGLVRQSPLLSRFPVHVIPNGLDTQVFRPIEKGAARKVLGMEPGTPAVLFGAHFATDRRKGAELFRQALSRLTEARRAKFELLIMGRESERWTAPAGVSLRRLGPIRDERLLATVYAAADLFVLPTLADNLPNGMIESMACGTPVVAFEIGGVPEAVRHMDTGYLARYKDVEDFSRGVALLLDDADLRQKMGRRCREVVEHDYSFQLTARRFLDLYRELIARRRSAAQ